MVRVKGYSDIDVRLIRATENPQEIVSIALAMTMRKDFRSKKYENLEKTLGFIIHANHTSVLEHVNYSFLIEGISRSGQLQGVRHRISSFTNSSQHHENHQHYGFRVDDSLVGNPLVQKAADQTMDLYKELIDAGIPISEARQVLPNGTESNMLYTTNARSLGNFLNLRLCEGNTREIYTVAHKIRALVVPTFPELWNQFGLPDCQLSECKQGKMKCNGGYLNGR